MNHDNVMTQNELRNAITLFQRGDFSEAEKIVTQLLLQMPENVDALHILGLMCLQLSQTQRGVELIQRAITIRADFAPAHNNLGNGLRNLNRLDESLAC